MRVGILVSLLIVAIVAIGCGGDDKKGGFLSGLGDGTSGANAGPDGANPAADARALATVIAKQGGANPAGGAQIPTGNSAAAPDPCALLTLDEAMTALKSKELKKDKESATANVMGSRECSYIGTGNNVSSISLTVIATAAMAPQMRSSGYNAKKQYDELKKLNKNPIAVKGISDDAWIDGALCTC
jgi:hypothetical protein